METVEVNIGDRIAAPLARVHEAIVDPAQMANYFISRGSARMITGANVAWEWSDVGATLAVAVREVEPARIVFDWQASGVTARVTITLTADAGATKLAIVEGSWPLTADGVKRALQQTQGWTDFLCSLKAFLVHGVNLRTGRPVTHP